MTNWIVWPAGQSHRAKLVRGKIMREWTMFVMGLRSTWPNPTKARRIRYISSPHCPDEKTAQWMATFIDTVV